MKTLVLACEVMKQELLQLAQRADVELSFLPMGLHLVPKRLNVTLGEYLARATQYDRVVLGFGVCGCATMGLVSPHAKLTLPRVHDCIALLLGVGGFEAETLQKGVFYLSDGWMNGEHSIGGEYQRVLAKFGAKKAARVMSGMFASYHAICFIRTNQQGSRDAEDAARSLAHLLKLELEIRDGSLGYLSRVVNGPWDDDDFVTLDPGVAVGAPSDCWPWRYRSNE